MSWSNSLREASFRGRTFEVRSTDDSGGRALVVAEYPGRDGALTQDQGGKPLRTRLTAVLWGPTCEDDLAALKAVLDEPGPGELVHPVLGVIQVAVESWGVRQGVDVGTDAAEVDISFIEHALDTPSLTVSTDTPAALESAAESALASAEDAIEEADEPTVTAKLSTWAGKVRNLLATVRDPSRVVPELRDAQRALLEVQSLSQDMIDTIRALRNPARTPLIRQVKATATSCADLFRVVMAEAPPYVEYPVRGPTTARQIAHEIYGDTDRAAEIVSLNGRLAIAPIMPGVILTVKAA